MQTGESHKLAKTTSFLTGGLHFTAYQTGIKQKKSFIIRRGAQMKGIPLTFLKMELQKAKALHAKNALSTKQDLLGEW